MKKFLLSLLIFLLVLACAAWLLYPTVAHQLYQGDVVSLRGRYLQASKALGSRGESDILERVAAWNEALQPEAPGDVFSKASARTSSEYQSLLNITEEVLALLEIPRIGVSLPVYHEGLNHSPAKELIHLSVSSLPMDAAPGHIMLAGPGLQKAEGWLGDLRLTGARMLEDLGTLIPGDLILMQLMNRALVYQVTEVQTITAEGMSQLDLTPAEDQDLLTLVTDQGTRRLLVSSRKIDISEAQPLLSELNQARPLSDPLSILLLGSPVLLLGLIVLWIIERVKRHAYRLPVSTDISALEEEDA